VHGLGGNRRRLEHQRRGAAHAGLISDAAAAEAAKGELTFVQISDSHIGFHLPPNPDPTATLTEAIDKIKAMPTQPAFLIHTGDISHLSKEEEWDTADQVIKSANKEVFLIPGGARPPTPTTEKPISSATAKTPTRLRPRQARPSSTSTISASPRQP
jgi:hypothetical protein